ncbi:MAG TPA: response regulator transcription factor [Actinomycetota bacterium]|nr:response regulator transcription factor [Actinomycetota bacterium]
MADIEILSDRPEDLGWLLGALEQAGHRVAVAALTESLSGPDPGLIFVDAAKDLSRGREACRGIHASSPNVTQLAIVAVEMLEAVGPDWGVDSFIVEGAHADEILARVRIAIGASLVDAPSALRVGELTIDPETYQVRLKGRPLDLTFKEFQLLLYLSERPGRVFSRSRLLQEVWGYDFFGGTRTVDVHVRRLRAKLGPEHEAMIATVRNVGYKLEAPSRVR